MDFLKKMIAADTTISSVKKNPALAYLSRLGSSRSVITISNCLKHIANILGAKDIESADWSKLKRTHSSIIRFNFFGKKTRRSLFPFPIKQKDLPMQSQFFISN